MATSFNVTLTGDQEVPPATTSASGAGTVTWDPETSTADYSIVVTGLDFGPVLGLEPQTETTEDDVTNAHFHNGPRGENGPVVFGQIGPAHDEDDLGIELEMQTVEPNGDGSWIVSGSWEPTDPAAVSITEFADELTAAAAGEDVPLYFNVHTTTFPAGEIRGQLVAAEDGVGPEPPPEEVDWNALAAVVLANFAATGQWFPGVELPPPPVDWDAVAAEVTANFEATGQWFL
jgi:serralysin